LIPFCLLLRKYLLANIYASIYLRKFFDKFSEKRQQTALFMENLRSGNALFQYLRATAITFYRHIDVKERGHLAAP
jgi:hypothetical protein